jgi:hypothetical protein
MKGRVVTGNGRWFKGYAEAMIVEINRIPEIRGLLLGT